MMFQLFDLIMTSPVGVLLFSKAQDVIYIALVISECDECAFNDLGKLLFGGVGLALLVGVGVSIVFWKKKDKHPNDTGFVSIRPVAVKKEDAR